MFEVVRYNHTAWHSSGIAGITVFRDRADAEAHLAQAEANTDDPANHYFLREV